MYTLQKQYLVLSGLSVWVFLSKISYLLHGKHSFQNTVISGWKTRTPGHSLFHQKCPGKQGHLPFEAKSTAKDPTALCKSLLCFEPQNHTGAPKKGNLC